MWTWQLGVVIIPGIENSPYLKQLYSIMGNRINIFELKEFTLQFWRLILDRKNAQIFHIHWLESLYRHRFGRFYLVNIAVPYLLIICKYALHYQLIVTLHNIKPHEFSLLDISMFKITLNLSDKIIVHNEFSAQLAPKIYGKELSRKIVVIPHGNFISYFPNNIPKHVARRRLGLDEEHFVFLFFGHIRPYKGLENLIDAFKIAFKGRKEIVLMIVGRRVFDWYQKVIESKIRGIKNCIVKHGFVPDTDVQLYLNAADMGVVTYKEIETPATVFLFISFKKGIIAPDLPPIREIAFEDFCIFFKPHSVQSLSEALLQAYSRRDEIQMFAIRAYNKALTYDWNTISQKTFALYTSSLSCFSKNGRN